MKKTIEIIKFFWLPIIYLVNFIYIDMKKMKKLKWWHYIVIFTWPVWIFIVAILCIPLGITFCVWMAVESINEGGPLNKWLEK